MSELNLCINYLNQLNHPNAKTREQAADNFWTRDCKTPGMLEKLIKALGDNSIGVRMYVRYSLEKMGKKAIPALVKALSHPNKIVRKEAVNCLSSMEHLAISAIPVLRKLAVKDPDYIVRIYAELAIKKILRPKPRTRQFRPERLRRRIRLKIKARRRKTWKKPHKVAKKSSPIYPSARKVVLQPKIDPWIFDPWNPGLAPKHPATYSTTRITTAMVPQIIPTTQRPDKEPIKNPKTFSPPINSPPIKWKNIVKSMRVQVDLDFPLEMYRSPLVLGNGNVFDDVQQILLGISPRIAVAYNIPLSDRFALEPTAAFAIPLVYSSGEEGGYLWEQEKIPYAFYNPRPELSFSGGLTVNWTPFPDMTHSFFLGGGVNLKPGINKKGEFGFYAFPRIEGRLATSRIPLGLSGYIILSHRGVDGFGVAFTLSLWKNQS